jgi:ubiquinone/menaquinone biosynthesis C-methylase UbiE
MNYKLLFPTYRNRYLFIRENLAQFGGHRKFTKALNLGTGEGDYDPMIASSCAHLIACDINENDLAFARQLNAGTPNLYYQAEDALNLSFPDNTFDLLTSVDVMEHVGKPERMIAEIARVLRPGGFAFITFPQINFPWTYDPVNRLLGRRAIAQGAYAFGHEYLVDPEAFKQWTDNYGLEVLIEKNLSGYLIALLEMYWTGVIQRIFKENAGNISGEQEKKGKLRPSVQEPSLVKITDLVIRLDNALFNQAKHSVGKGFVLRKQ